MPRILQLSLRLRLDQIGRRTTRITNKFEEFFFNDDSLKTKPPLQGSKHGWARLVKCSDEKTNTLLSYQF